MRRLHSFLTIALLTAGSASVGQAQTPQGTPQGTPQPAAREDARGGLMAPTAQIDRMLQGITLTAPQAAAVDSLKARYAPRLQAARQEMMAARQAGGDIRPIRVRNMELQAKAEAELRALLTTEQVEALDANKAAMAERMRPGQGAQGGGGRPPRV